MVLKMVVQYIDASNVTDRIWIKRLVYGVFLSTEKDVQGDLKVMVLNTTATD